MNKEFGELSGMYQKAKRENDIAKQNEVLQLMRTNVKNRGGDLSDDISYDKLLVVNGELNKVEESQNLTDICEREREKHISRKHNKATL